MKTTNPIPEPLEETTFRGKIGFGKRDITPPIGIYSRMWGAARHDTAESVHRPLIVGAVAFFGSNEKDPLIYLQIDTCVIRHSSYPLLEKEVQAATGVNTPGRIVIQATHTHSGCPFSPENVDRPGGHLIPAYIEALHHAVGEAAAEAVARAEDAYLSWRSGWCGLAVNRDLPEPGADGQTFACGLNPARPADTTLAVGRVTAVESGKVIGILAHYACHPTTLAWDNSSLSPDWLGAAREEVATALNGAQLLVLQGASGDQAPRVQYSGDTATADRNGREFAHAVLSITTGMLPAGQRYTFDRVVRSGADLAAWKFEPGTPPQTTQSRRLTVDLPLKPYDSTETLNQQLAACTDTALAERLRRQILRVSAFDGSSRYSSPVILWQLGSTVWISQPEENFACFQQELRALYPDRTVLPLNLAAGPTVSYIYPPDRAGDSLYQVWVSTFAADAYDHQMQCIRQALAEFLANGQP